MLLALSGCMKTAIAAGITSDWEKTLVYRQSNVCHSSGCVPPPSSPPLPLPRFSKPKPPLPSSKLSSDASPPHKGSQGSAGAANAAHMAAKAAASPMPTRIMSSGCALQPPAAPAVAAASTHRLGHDVSSCEERT